VGGVRGVALGVDEVAGSQVKCGAVGEELVEAGVGEALGPLGLVLGVDDGE
jgi:hypothetical protein